jgi:hypothetical protein
MSFEGAPTFKNVKNLHFFIR